MVGFWTVIWITALPWRLLLPVWRQRGETEITRADRVDISYPDFYKDLEKLKSRKRGRERVRN